MEPTRLLSLCPECGLATDPKAPVLGHAALRKRLPWFAVLLALVGLGVWCWAGYGVWPGLRSGTEREPDVVRPSVTRAALEAIRDGRASDGNVDGAELLRSLDTFSVPGPPGGRKLSVGWVRPAGTVIRRFALGWPSTFLWFFRTTAYSDALERRGRLECTTDTRLPRDPDFWRLDSAPNVPPHRLVGVYGFFTHGIEITPPPEWTGGDVVECRLDFEGLGLLVLVVLICWWGWPRAVRLFCAKTRRPLETRWTRRLNRGRIGAAVGLIGFLGVSGIFAHYWASPEVPDLRLMKNYRSAAVLNMTLPTGGPKMHELPGLWSMPGDAKSADAARDLARTIINVLDEAHEPSKGRCLAAAATAEAAEDDRVSRTTVFPAMFPLVYFSEKWYVRRAEFGPVERMAYPKHFALHGLDGVEWSSGDATDPRCVVLIMPGRICVVVLSIVGMWWVTMMFCSGRFSRGYRRRLRGQCAGCGYPVVAASSTVARTEIKAN